MRVVPAPTAAAEALFFAGVGLFALLTTFGANGFLYPLLYRLAPGWSLFRGQERSAYLFSFALSILAAYGAVTLVALNPRRRRAAVFAWTGLAGAALVITVIALLPSLDASQRAALWRGVAIGAAGLLACCAIAASHLNTRRSILLLTAVALVELFAANQLTNLAGRPALPSPASVAVEASVAAASVAGQAPPHAQNEARLPEDYGMLVGVEDISGSSPLRLARYDDFLHDFPRPGCGS